MERSDQNITVQFKQEYFNTRFPFDPRRDVVWSAVTKYIQSKFIKRSDRVLDLGAAYCDFINHVDAAEKHALDVFERLDEFVAATGLEIEAVYPRIVAEVNGLLPHGWRELLRVVCEAHREQAYPTTHSFKQRA